MGMKQYRLLPAPRAEIQSVGFSVANSPGEISQAPGPLKHENHTGFSQNGIMHNVWKVWERWLAAHLALG